MCIKEGVKSQIVPFQKVNFEASKLALASIKEGVGGRLSLSKSSIFEISFSFYKKGGRGLDCHFQKCSIFETLLQFSSERFDCVIIF